MHSRHNNPRLNAWTSWFQGLAACVIPIIVILMPLFSCQALAGSGLLLSISNLQLDRYVTRTPGQVGVQMPIRKQRSSKLPVARHSNVLDTNPNRDFNHLWLLNHAGNKPSRRHETSFGAGLQLFRSKHVTGDLYYLTDDAGLPRADETEYLLGMSPDQFRFRLQLHF